MLGGGGGPALPSSPATQRKPDAHTASGSSERSGLLLQTEHTELLLDDAETVIVLKPRREGYGDLLDVQ
jgi:hypothetical protein